METSNTDRIIVLVDMDCFYVQVEQKLCPEYQSTPCAVVQYNTWKGGGIIAVNYEARAKGVTRFLRGDEAQKACPDIHLFRVPEVRGKADLTRYRDAGASVLEVLCEYSDCVERASVDEAYLDMTSVINLRMETAPHVTADQLGNTFVVGWEGDNPEYRKEELQKWLDMIYEEEHLYKDRMLALAAVITEEMRTAVYEKTGYRCSAGIAHNKMLAKLSCGIHKPNKQTVLPQSSINILFKTMPIKKVRNLGGKLGEAIIKKFNVEKMGDLIDIPKSVFVNEFGEKTGHWLYNIVRGMDNESVTSRQLPKSIGCGKNFSGKSSLSTKDSVAHWLKQLSTELEERLIKDQNTNQRFARLLTISVRSQENTEFSVTSRSCPIHLYNAEKLASDALLAISKLNTSSSDTIWNPSVWTLSMAASKFENKLDNSHCDIQSYFSAKCSDSNDGTNNKESTESIPSIIEETQTMKFVNDADLKSTKSCNTSNKDIISFFTKKQLNKIESVENSVTVNTIQDASKSEESYSSLSDCSSTNNCISDNVTDNDFHNAKVKEISCIAEDLDQNSILSEKQNQSIGFFAKKLEEKTKFRVNIEKSPYNEDVNFKQTNTENSELPVYNETLVPSSSTSKNLPSLCSEDDEYSNLDPELTKLCDKCNKRIPIWEETEHLDYHFAFNLSKEFSAMPNSNNSFVGKSSVIGKNVSKSKSSRKRGSVNKSSSQSKKPLMQTKTLDAFFK